MGGNTNVKVGMAELVIFLAALVAGTGCSLTSKIMLDMEGIGMTGEMEKFSFPLFQTFGMFIGMTAGLLMHFAVLAFKIPFPGYVHKSNKEYSSLTGQPAGAVATEEPEALPLWIYFALIVPSVFDLIATSLCMFGLRYVNVSIYQMLRGGAIVFVAFLKHFMLGDRLKSFMWIGVFWNVVSIVLVGGSAMFSGGDGGEDAENAYNNPIIGVGLVLLGAFVQSLQYAFEEKVMTMDIAAPPLLLIGMEGLWGTLLCVFVLYPIAYYSPGADHGSFENPFNTIYMMQNSSHIQFMFTIYFFCIFFYNMLAVLVTYMLNSVWHAILDNFRPITVWVTDLFIFYVLATTNMGEAWTVWSWMQLGGMVVLLYGTAIYNAPNPGSLLLKGGCMDCFMDFTHEYDQIEAEEANAMAATETGVEPVVAPSHTVYSTMSPFMSPRIGAGTFSTPLGMTPRTSRKLRMEFEQRAGGAGAGAGAGDYRGYGSTGRGGIVGMVPLHPDAKQKSFA